MTEDSSRLPSNLTATPNDSPEQRTVATQSAAKAAARQGRLSSAQPLTRVHDDALDRQTGVGGPEVNIPTAFGRAAQVRELSPSATRQAPSPLFFGPEVERAQLLMTSRGLVLESGGRGGLFAAFDPEKDIPGMEDGGEEQPGGTNAGGGKIRIRKKGLKHDPRFSDPPQGGLPTTVGAIVLFVFEPPSGTVIHGANCELQFVNYATRTTTYTIFPPPDAFSSNPIHTSKNLSRERHLDNKIEEDDPDPHTPTYPGQGSSNSKMWKIDQPGIDDAILQAEAISLLKGLGSSSFICFTTVWVLEAWTVKICNDPSYEILNKKTETVIATSCWDSHGNPIGPAEVTVASGGPATTAKDIPDGDKEKFKEDMEKFKDDDPAWGQPK